MHKLIQEVRVRNPLGLHARPSSTIAQLLQGTKSSVTIHYRSATANAKSVMELLMLAVKQGARVKIAVEGEDAPDVMERLVQAFDRGFEPLIVPSPLEGIDSCERSAAPSSSPRSSDLASSDSAQSGVETAIHPEEGDEA